MSMVSHGRKTSESLGKAQEAADHTSIHGMIAARAEVQFHISVARIIPRKTLVAFKAHAQHGETSWIQPHSAAFQPAHGES